MRIVSQAQIGNPSYPDLVYFACKVGVLDIANFIFGDQLYGAEDYTINIAGSSSKEHIYMVKWKY